MAASAPNDRDARIGPTAYYTSYVWHRLRLPHAEVFATPQGAAMYWGAKVAGEWLTHILPGLPTMGEYLAQRHLSFERALEDFGPDCIVELGAGLSRRGLTWAVDRGVPYVEIDLPHMSEAKRAALSRRLSPELRAAAEARLRLVSRDILADDFADWLIEALGDARRPAVVIEGVLPYFELGDKQRVASAAAKALRARGEGLFLCDVRAREGGPAVEVAALLVRFGIRMLTRGRGAAPDFESVEAIERFFADAGFDGATPIDPRKIPRVARIPIVPGRVWAARIGPR